MTKSRKRMLLSSIAMLLVALVALGSATYAWFTISKTVSADNMTVKAIAPSGIVISNTKDASGWSDYTPDGVHYTDSGTVSLKPVSWDASTLSNARYVTDDDVTTGGKETGLTYQTVTEAYTDATTKISGATTEAYKSDNYFAVYDMSIKSDDSHTNCYAKVEVNGTDAAGFVRAVLIDTTNSNAVKGVFGAAASSDDGTNQVINATDGTPKSVTLTPFGENNTVSIANITSTATDYKLVVWYEGYDAECKDTNINATGAITVTFGFA